MFLQSPARKLRLLDVEYGFADLTEEPGGVENFEDEWMGSKLDAVDYENALPEYSPSRPHQPSLHYDARMRTPFTMILSTIPWMYWDRCYRTIMSTW